MVLSSTKPFIHLKSLLLSAVLAAFAAAVLVIVAEAQDSTISWVCSPGYVWRDAFKDDLVCVTPQRRAEVQAENAEAEKHIDPNWAVYAFTHADDCRHGYYWRLAGPNDRVDPGNSVDRKCVTAEASDQAAYESDHPYDHMDIRYNYPRWGNLLFGGYRLDLCLDWNSSCRGVAAENFCHYQGWTGARNYAEDLNIGASQPTQGMYFKSNSVCDQTECDGFKYITCYGNISSDRVYRNPKWLGHRLDICLQGNDGCGKPTADAYCRWKGFTGTFYYFVNRDFLSSNLDAITMGDGQVYAANKNRLKSFDVIICQ